MNLQPPTPFSFTKSDEWPKWKRRFEQYRQASGLVEKGEQRQVSTLLYCLGPDAEEVLNTTRISEGDKKKYEKVIDEFDKYFKVKKNVIYERARFNQRCQLLDESSDHFITEIHRLADNCEFGEMKDQLIRDRLVVGIRDGALSERLQLESDLTLDKAKQLIRQREAVRAQQEILHKPQTKADTSLDAVRQSTTTRRKLPAIPHTSKPPLGNCRRCGNGIHPRHLCPAKEATCFKCNRRGHYSSQCLSNTVATISVTPPQPQVEQEVKFLDTIDGAQDNVWETKVMVGDKRILFKVDTGAEVTVISEETWKSLQLAEPLQHPKTFLCGPDHTRLTVLGKIMLSLTLNETCSEQPVYVVKNITKNLLGLPAIKALSLLSHVESVDKNIVSLYSSLFTGLGTFTQEYKIQLKANAQPFALNTPRNIPLALRPKVHAELERMEGLGVISRVREPTPWCAAMVVVPKPSGAVRICVDMKPLNENVLREVHPMPKVDTTLAQLTGATVFSKLDANSGFWQIPLAKESRLLTTFITPYGRFCFNKLPFGISSAPEVFQCHMNDILSGLPGVLCHVDDILVFGTTPQEHDERLQAVLERIKSAGVTLNAEKCQFSQTRITFLGHVIDHHGISPDPRKTAAILAMTPPSSVTELRRFMGMVNQMTKFSPNIAQISKPLRELLSTKNAWTWEAIQAESFTKLKEEISSPRVLALYDPLARTKISADASAYGLGAVLLQKQHDQWRPIAFSSRSLSETELRYAQIEKEALALTWALEKFSEYTLGKVIQLETDHKPLVPLLGQKSLDLLPPRVLRFRLRLMRFQYTIQHVPGKSLYTADTLSRAPLKDPSDTAAASSRETEQFVQAIRAVLPASADRLDEYAKKTGK